MAQNLIEKIVQKFAVNLPEGAVVHSGDFVTLKPAHVMTHDNTGAVIPKFMAIGAKKPADPRQPVYTLDHNIQDNSDANKQKYQKIESFAKEMGIDFYPAGRGIGHQIMCEEGYAFPGSMAVASDSHSNMYGGLGCLGTPIVRTDAAAIWASGQTWWQIPPAAKVILKGKMNPGVTGKDVIITLAGHFNKDEVLNHALEFSGDGVKTLSIDQRLSIANMTTEWGALVGLFPIDDITYAWLENRDQQIIKRGLAGVPSDADSGGEHPRINKKTIADLRAENLQADEVAYYAKEITIDLSSVQPSLSGPDTLKVMQSVNEAQGKDIKINKAYLVSCVNSRHEDIKQAADVLRGRKIHPDVEFYAAAASDEVQQQAEEDGSWQALLDAGAIALPPGCGPCIGLGMGLLEDGEVGISATNRNFKGRMGSKNAKAYLASPAVVAASAAAGKIVLPAPASIKEISASISEAPQKAAEAGEVPILDGFPEKLSGDIIFCPADNLNTDGIYPGKYTYKDDITPEEQAEVVMENYDPEFGKIVKQGDILAGGFTFGTGSSREQAATALKYRGLQLVLAGSFSQTYKRNAINNGYLVIEAPDLINDLKAQFGTDKLTVKTGIKAEIDFKAATVNADGKIFSIPAVGTAAQELIISGGLENWVKQRLAE